MTVFPGGGSLPLAPPYATGLLLIGLAPAAPFLPIMVRRAGAIGRAIVGSVA